MSMVIGLWAVIVLFGCDDVGPGFNSQKESS